MSVLRFVHRHRRLAGWLMLGVWLAILPLRGWAETSMHLAAWSQPGKSQGVSAMPCHGGANGSGPTEAQGDAGAAADEAPPSAEDGAACATCVLCHVPAMPAGDAALVFEPASLPDPAASSTDCVPPTLPLPERPPRS
jgi:hypothetical protein